MGEKLSGVEASAVGIIKRAMELDHSKRFTESLVCYQEGIQLLLDVLKATTDDTKRNGFRGRITEYMDRAETLKKYLAEQKDAGKYHEQIQIANNSTGFSYEKIFGRFLDEQLSNVEVEDPYIRNVHQIYNFVRFCEMLVKSPAPLKSILLVTGADEGQEDLQQKRLDELRQSLSLHGIALTVQYSQTLHDREVRFNNGWIVKIGRGLDFFRPTQGKFVIGYCDFDLRHCHETTIDIFHKKHVISAS